MVSSKKTEREQLLEQELQQLRAQFEIEKRWQFALEGAGDGIWDWNVQTDIVFFSPQWKTMLGYQEQEIGTTLDEWDKRIYPEDKANVYSELKKYMKGDTPVYSSEHRLLCKDGSYKWILDRGKVMSWTPEGQPLRMVGTHTDISEQKRSEEILRCNKEETQAILKAVPDLLFHIDRNGTILTHHAPSNSDLYVPPEMFLGKKLHEILPPHVALPAMEAITQALQTKEMVVFEYELEKQGDSRFFEDRVVPLSGDECLSVIRDITQRKRAEEARRESEERYHLFLEQATNAIYVFDINTADVIEVNTAFCNLLGYTQEEIQHITIYDIVAHDRNDIDDYISIIVMKKNLILGERRWRKKDGTIIDVHVTASYIARRDSGYIFFIGNDITERKNAEEALRKSEEQYRLLFENSPAAILSITPQGQILEVNPAALQLLGSPSVEATKSINFLTFPLLIQAGVTGDFLQCIETGTSMTFERSYTSKWGKSVNMHYRMTPISGINGQTSLVQLMIEDITERKRTEEALRQSEELFSKAFRSNPTALSISRLSDGKIIDLNGSYSQLLGYSREELLDNTTLDLNIYIDPSERNKVIDLLKNTESITLYETKLRTKSGIIKSILISAETIDLSGELTMITSLLDITERKEALEKIKQSVSLLRATLESTDDGILVVDGEGKVTGFNERFAQLWRIPSPLLETQDDSKLLDFVLDQLKYPQQFLTKVQELYSEPDAESFDLLEFNDNRIFERYSKPQRIDEKAVGRVWSFRDVTQRKRAEEQLYIRNAAIQSSINAIGISDLAGKITYVNDAFLRLWDYREANEVQDKHYSEFVVSNKQFELTYASMKSTGSYSGEMTALRNDGSTFEVLVSMNIVKSNEGAPICFMASFVDITDRKKKEEQIHSMMNELKLSEEKYRSLFEESKDMIYIATPEGRFLDVNRAGVELFGFESRVDLLDTNLNDLYINTHDRDYFLTSLEENGYIQQTVLKLKTKDGKPLTVNVTATIARDQEGNFNAYRGIIHDVTKQQSLQAELIQAQKMESLGTLAAGIAHDFNNILAIILGHIGLIKKTQNDPVRFARSVESVEKATARGASLVRQLLTFARKTETVFESLQISFIIKEVVKLVNETFPKTIIIETHLQPDPPSITADATQIHQVILNLCVNARDAMPDGGKLTISSEVVKGEQVRKLYPAATGREYLSITVSDTGVGIDETTRKRIFEPFFTTKGPGKGTGLGLSIVFGVIESHKGFIDVHSKPGTGTSFTIYFPVEEHRTEIRENYRANAKHVKGGNETILLIEDEESLRTMVQLHLTDKGYKILTAADGMEGIAVYNQHSLAIRLVITDMGLPRLTGYQVFQTLRQTSPDLKIIIASGYFDPEIKADMIKDGVNEFLLKPFLPSELISTVRAVLDAK